MKIKLIILSLVVILTCNTGYSQEQNNEFDGGSPYTIFGIGDLRYNTSSRTFGMGVLGLGLQGDYINNLNPASNSGLIYTKFSISADYGYLKSTDGTQTTKVNEGNINGLNIGIPLSKDHGWVMNFGINPLSSVGYQIISNGVSGGEAYTNTFSGEGGLTRLNFAMTYTFLKSLSIGAEYNYAFGNIISQGTTVFENPALTGNYSRRETDLSKSFFKGGLVFSLENLVNKKSKNLRHLAFGFVFQSGIDLTANEESIITSIVTTDSNVVRTGTVSIPSAYGFGISNQFGDRVNVAADAYFQQWSEYSSFGVTPSNFVNSMRFGAGLELLPSPDRDKDFFQRLTYRAGAFYDQAYYTVNSENINTLGFRAGFGIPISNFNSIDLNFSYSIRGKEGNGLIKDELFSIYAGVNFGELWFIRPNDDF
jgi:hypothetical protein